MFPSAATAHIANDAAIMSGTLIRINWLLTSSGVTRADVPRISKILMMLLPMTFPTATSALLVNAACRLTPSSGALVPNATTVKPITRGEMRKVAAIAEAPCTSNSPPPSLRQSRRAPNTPGEAIAILPNGSSYLTVTEKRHAPVYRINVDYDGSQPPPPPPPPSSGHSCAGRDATIVGTNGDDVLIGTDGVDVIVGLGGDDVIRGLERGA